MYKSFTARNFRCFDDFTIRSLERVNLIAGKNNIGKTALLEALWLHHGYHNPELGLRLRVLRGLGSFKRDEFLWDLFAGFDPEKTIELSGRDQDNRICSLQITIREHPTSRVSLHEHMAERNGEPMATELIEQETTAPVESKVLFDYTNASGKNVQAYAYVESSGIRFERPTGIRQPRDCTRGMGR